jgi:hypothetical protein
MKNGNQTTTLTLSELKVTIENKEKALTDLANWLAGRSSETDEFKKVLKDKQLLADDINHLKEKYSSLELELEGQTQKHNHTSFEL